MRYAEIEHGAKAAPALHPYISVAEIDPAVYPQLIERLDDHPELRLVGIVDCLPAPWIAYVGCASRRVQDAFDSWINSL